MKQFLLLLPSLVLCERPSFEALQRREIHRHAQRARVNEKPVPRVEPIAGSQTWPENDQSERCKVRNAYACEDGQHCCCMFGCTYDVEEDNCTACSASDPLVRNFHIPSSHLWKERIEGLCTVQNAHLCGASCCCNAAFRWNMETRRCEATEHVAEAKEEVRVKPVPAEDLVPGSQTWTSEDQSCESRNAYLCADGHHCCCRFGFVFSAEEDRCSASTDMSDVTSFHIPASHLWTERIEEGTCEPTHSHPCGKSCCCNGKYRWDLEQRLCVLSNEVAEETPFRGLQGPPPKAEAIPGSQTWLGSVTCKDKNAYNCGDHCCCMFGCEYDSEKDACTSCTADDPLVVKYHIPASHLWPSREKQLCDEPFSHLCGKACCCNGDYLWDMEQRRCVPYQASQDSTETKGTSS